MTVFDYVKKEAQRIAGVPVLESDIDDDMFLREIVAPSTYEYFVYAPYEHALYREVSASGMVPITIPDLNTVRTDWPETIDNEYVGLVGIGFNNTPASGGLISLSSLLDEPRLGNQLSLCFQAKKV